MRKKVFSFILIPVALAVITYIANPTSAATDSDFIYHVAGNLNIEGNNDGDGTGVVFVDGNLNFNGNYCYGATGATATGTADDCSAATSPAGLIGAVYIVKGDINIASNVTRIDAVLIAEGTIYTEGAECSKSSPPAGSPLTINGSLISLNPLKPPVFCRTLLDNSQPAEKINHQVKYLVILRNLISDTYQKWSEIP